MHVCSMCDMYMYIWGGCDSVANLVISEVSRQSSTEHFVWSISHHSGHHSRDVGSYRYTHKLTQHEDTTVDTTPGMWAATDTHTT